MKEKYSLVLILIASALAVSYFMWPKALPKKQGTVDTVFIGPKEHSETLSKSMASAKQFHDRFRRALELSREKNYQAAISLLNESLPYATFKGETAMVYELLSEIYRDQSDLESELKNLELYTQFTRNDRLRTEANTRAAELRQLIATKSQATQTQN